MGEAGHSTELMVLHDLNLVNGNSCDILNVPVYTK